MIFLKNKFIFKIFSLFFLLLISCLCFADYKDYAIEGVYLPKTVKEGNDLNLTIVLTSNLGEARTADVNFVIYHPSGIYLYSAVWRLNMGENNVSLENTGEKLIYNTQPYLLRANLTASDDNPMNDFTNHYFAVSKSKDTIPISDVPFFFGVVLAFLFIFVLTTNKKSKSKK